MIRLTDIDRVIKVTLPIEVITSDKTNRHI